MKGASVYRFSQVTPVGAVFAAFIAGALVVTTAAGTRAQSSDPADSLPRAVLVVDGSGSMWGPLNNSSKISIARRGIAQALPTFGRRMQLGLVAYGHRRRGDCSDIERILPVQPLLPGRMAQAVDGVSPRGKTPINDALLEAGEALDYRNRPGTIILLSDGYENCRKDPCRTVAEMRREAKDLTVHVVGLALNDRDRSRIQCIAREGNGEMREGASVEELAEQMTEVLALAARVAGSIARAGEAEAEPGGPPGLALGARFAEGGLGITEGVRWRVVRKADPEEVVLDAMAANPRLDVAPGEYVVEARKGLAQVRREVTVAEKGPTRAVLNLDAGTVRLRTLAHRGGGTVADVFYTILSQDGQGRGEVIARSQSAEPIYHLPAGDYRVTVVHGRTQTEQNVTVRAGERRSLDIELNVGELRLGARSGRTGAALDHMLYLVHEDDPDAPDGRREVARSAAERPNFMLPAGVYHVAARHGRAEVESRVTVLSGERNETVLTLDAGRVEPRARIAGSEDFVSEGVSFALHAADSEEGGAPLVRTSLTAPVLRLPAGMYRITSSYGPANARAEAEVRVVPGDTRVVELTYDAGHVSLQLLSREGTAPLREVYWQIVDGSGTTVWRTGLAEPATPLAAGEYEAVAEHRGRRYVRAFDVATGERRQVRLFTR